MKSVRDILSDFSGMGALHSFQMHSGHEYEGWIVGVEDDYILFVDSDQAAAKDEVKIRLRAIALGTLAYHDEEERCWINARWNESGGQWELIVISHDEPPEEALKVAQEPEAPQPFWSKLSRLKKQ